MHSFSWVHKLHCFPPIDILYTLDSAPHPAGERKFKPDRSRILRQAAILVVPTERDNLYILYYGITEMDKVDHKSSFMQSILVF
jgi:hypothetical protein